MSSLTLCVKDVIVYRQLLEHLGFKQEKPTPVYTDSQSGIRAMFRSHTSQRVKHFAIKLAWLRQQEESGLVVY